MASTCKFTSARKPAKKNTQPPTPPAYLAVTFNQQALAELAHKSDTVQKLRDGLSLTAPTYDSDSQGKTLTIRYQRA